jgi:hypothetical protein
VSETVGEESLEGEKGRGGERERESGRERVERDGEGVGEGMRGRYIYGKM